jgi:hypothetical protein
MLSFYAWISGSFIYFSSKFKSLNSEKKFAERYISTAILENPLEKSNRFYKNGID